MSTTTKACRTARPTISAWYTISSSVTGKVVAWPCTTIERLSPTRMPSMPAVSTSPAMA